jgi:hypothetical protein
MGRSHALSGLVAGLAVGPAVGLTTLPEMAPFAVTVAGYSLFPDLDCKGATASRVLGPITGLLSRLLTTTSAALYQVTKGPRDEKGRGTHRHLTHCGLFAILLGLVAAATSTLSPWVVVGWLAFGLLLAQAAGGDWVLGGGGAAVAGPRGLGAAPVAVLAPMQGWVGLAVGLGCLCHIAGDAVTRSGVPILFPLPIAGETWYEVRLLGPLSFTTGKGVENWVVFPALAVAVVLLIPGVWPHVSSLVVHVGEQVVARSG